VDKQFLSAGVQLLAIGFIVSIMYYQH